MPRVPDWPDRLQKILGDMAARPFEWGTADCFTWAVLAACFITGAEAGTSYGGPFYEAYGSRTGALRILAQHSMLEVGDEAFGNRVPALCARRGDIALVPTGDGGEAFAIVDHERAIAPCVDGGITHVPLDRAVAAWRIG
jgi:hypothetical protein